MSARVSDPGCPVAGRCGSRLLHVGAPAVLLAASLPFLLGSNCDVVGPSWPEDSWPGGIGAILGHSSAEHRLVVRGVPPDSPAEEAGLQVGDEILELDGHVVAEMQLSEVLAALRGEVGTRLKLKLRRGEETLELEIRRAPYSD